MHLGVSDFRAERQNYPDYVMIQPFLGRGDTYAINRQAGSAGAKPSGPEPSE